VFGKFTAAYLLKWTCRYWHGCSLIEDENALSFPSGATDVDQMPQRKRSDGVQSIRTASLLRIAASPQEAK